MFHKFKTKMVSKIGRGLGRGFGWRSKSMLTFFIRILKLLSRQGIFRVILKNNLKMLIDLNDDGISKDLLLYRWREAEACKIFESYLKPGQLVIDIGSNIGFYAIIEAKYVGSSGVIYAIEPGEKNFELLNKNVKINHYEKIIKTYCGAISNESGSKSLHIANRSNLHTLNRVPAMDNYVKFINIQEVSTYSLDDFIEENKIEPRKIDIIRMDIEGHEYFALDGMIKTLQKIETLLMFIEIHPKLIKEISEQAYEKFILKLSSCGFEMVACIASLSSRKDKLTNLKDIKELLSCHEAIEVFLKKGFV